MFTGIIEALGVVQRIETIGSNCSFWISSPISHQLQVDQSVSHDGVCLTIESADNGTHKVTAISETLAVTTLNSWEKGSSVNLERCLVFNGRLDGHLVQGHVDAMGICKQITDKDGSWEYVISFDRDFAELVIEKGSICLNGISLTAFDITDTTLTVAIIPYTFNNTSIGDLKVGMKVNLEFDVIGKYLARKFQLNNK